MYPPDGDRLPARDAQGALLPEGRALLGEGVEVRSP